MVCGQMHFSSGVVAPNPTDERYCCTVPAKATDKIMRVFIENEAGSRRKHIYDRNLAVVRTVEVSAAYPYPYGFVLGTTGGDGDAVDCFVLTETPLCSGSIVECQPIGLLEQVEDGGIDHKVLAVLPGAGAGVE